MILKPLEVTTLFFRIVGKICRLRYLCAPLIKVLYPCHQDNFSGIRSRIVQGGIQAFLALTGSVVLDGFPGGNSYSPEVKNFLV